MYATFVSKTLFLRTEVQQEPSLPLDSSQHSDQFSLESARTMEIGIESHFESTYACPEGTHQGVELLHFQSLALLL